MKRLIGYFLILLSFPVMTETEWEPKAEDRASLAVVNRKLPVPSFSLPTLYSSDVCRVVVKY